MMPMSATSSDDVKPDPPLGTGRAKLFQTFANMGGSITPAAGLPAQLARLRLGSSSANVSVEEKEISPPETIPASVDDEDIQSIEREVVRMQGNTGKFFG